MSDVPEMVEKVALVIANAWRRRDQNFQNNIGPAVGVQPYELKLDRYLPAARETARAAIEALREPTEAMVDAAAVIFAQAPKGTLIDDLIRQMTTAMIDAALKP